MKKQQAPLNALIFIKQIPIWDCQKVDSVFCKMSHAAVTFYSYSTHSVRTRFVCRFWEKPCIPFVSNIYLEPLPLWYHMNCLLYRSSRCHRELLQDKWDYKKKKWSIIKKLFRKKSTKEPGSAFLVH